ncbi:hypothetical protein LPJ77_003659, partial [Coemansia sp. RSA 2523]
MIIASGTRIPTRIAVVREMPPDSWLSLFGEESAPETDESSSVCVSSSLLLSRSLMSLSSVPDSSLPELAASVPDSSLS